MGREQDAMGLSLRPSNPLLADMCLEEHGNIPGGVDPSSHKHKEQLSKG